MSAALAGARVGVRGAAQLCTALDSVPTEPAFVLLAERLSPAELGSALRLLLDPLQPDGSAPPHSDPYSLELRTLRDGDVDVRSLLDPETGQSLAAEIARRLAAVGPVPPELRTPSARTSLPTELP